MDFSSLFGCISSASCLVTQSISGLTIGMLLFLVASGLSLIFGVLKITNFAHGSFYMLGAYFALTVYQVTNNYFLAVCAAALGVGLFGVLFERFLIRRIYGSNVLMQLLLSYAVILILDDVVMLVWGSEFQAMGMPEMFRVPPLRFAGAYIPAFYIFLILAAFAIAGGLWFLIEKTRFGKVVRAAAHNGDMASALGINTSLLYSVTLGLGGVLAGLAGGLAAPVRSLVPGMGMSILIESFIVTVIGGMGSIMGAFLSAIIIGLTRSFGGIVMPEFTEGLMFLVMVIVLIVKPTGLFSKGQD